MATVLIPLSPDARGTRRVGAHLGSAGLRCGPLRGGDLARTAWKGAGQVWPGQCPRPLPVGKASLNRRQTASRDLLATLGVVRTEFFESLIYQTSSGESWLPPVAGVQCRTDSVAGTGVKHPGLAIFFGSSVAVSGLEGSIPLRGSACGRCSAWLDRKRWQPRPQKRPLVRGFYSAVRAMRTTSPSTCPGGQ